MRGNLLRRRIPRELIDLKAGRTAPFTTPAGFYKMMVSPAPSGKGSKGRIVRVDGVSLWDFAPECRQQRHSLGQRLGKVELRCAVSA